MGGLVRGTGKLMEIISLQIQNFLTIGKQVSINLSNQGLVLIQGVNEDDTSAGSNGAGKSTVADALCWAIYNETARGESGDLVVNDTAKKDCYARVVIKDENSYYDIVRYRKHSDFKNQTIVNAWDDSSGLSVKDISKGTEKETQELINEIMGCSYEVFVAAIYAGQEEMPDIPKMTDKQLKVLIEEAAGVQRLEQAYELARKDAMIIEDTLKNVSIKKANVEINIINANEKLESENAHFNLFESNRKHKSDEHKATAMRFLEKVRVLVADLALRSPSELKTQLAGLQTRVDGIKLLQDNLNKFRETHNGQLIAVSKQAVVMSGIVKEGIRLSKQYENAEAEMAKPCGECGKPHDASELVKFKERILKSLNRENEIHVVEAKKLNALEQSEVIAKEALLKAEGELASVNPAEILNESNTINAQLAKIQLIESEITANKKEATNYIEKAKLALSEDNSHKAIIDFINDSIATAKATIKTLKLFVLELEENAAIVMAQVKVFGPAGVRAHILDTVTPFLNDRTSDYLSALSDGNITAIWTTITKTAKGELRERFNIEVANDKGGKSFKLLSGGEKRKVRLATMLALQDLVASRASKPINLWIGDEIDDALDAAGLERLMGILERKARERGTVLVISHADLKDWIDNVLTVTKRGGYSTIEGALCLT